MPALRKNRRFTGKDRADLFEKTVTQSEIAEVQIESKVPMPIAVRSAYNDKEKDDDRRKQIQ